ncbi:MAG: helicase C-terminal domain-containing protein, partial [Candidatus Thorarchaeota archaeon]
LYLTRTHSQTAQVAKEIQQINQKKGLHVKCVVRGSRRWLCLSGEVRACQNQEAVEKCLTGLTPEKVVESRLTDYLPGTKEPSADPELNVIEEKKHLVCGLVAGKKVSVPTEIPQGMQQYPVADMETLIRFGEEARICPYFLSKLLSRHRQVVISPYNYLFRDLPIWRSIILFDEAHNLEKVCKDVYTVHVSEITIEEAILELSYCGGFAALNLSELLEEFSTVFQRLDPGRKTRILKKEELLALFGRHGLSENFFEALRDSLDDITTTGRELAAHRGKGFPMELLRSFPIFQFLQTLVSDPAEYFVGILERKKQQIQLSWLCLDPSLAFNEIRRRAPHAILLMSGTLNPMESLVKLLKIPDAVTRSYDSIINPQNMKLFGLWRGPNNYVLSTKFTRRKNPQVVIEYGLTVTKIISQIPNGSLVFFPSHALMSRFLYVWRRTRILEVLKKKTTLFLEGISTNKNLIQDYKATANEQRATLFSVCRGTLSEGVDFPNATGRAVILVGVPYPDLSDPRLKVQQKFYEAKVPGLGAQWYQDEAIRTVNQTLGRVWRHKDDYALGFLLDSRYASQPIRTRLSSWIVKSLEFPDKHTPFSVILKKAQQFFQKQSATSLETISQDS